MPTETSISNSEERNKDILVEEIDDGFIVTDHSLDLSFFDGVDR